MPQADRAQAQLVENLVRDGRVRSPRVREAFASVPRHAFLPELSTADAYADEAVPIKVEDGVTLSSVSQPSMVAIMLEQLGAEPGHRVLEIGAGTGWNAALLAHIVGPGGAVVTLDIDEDLVDRARRALVAAGVTGVEARATDGARGHPDGAPYDRIELTVGSTDIRPEWIDQLTPGGRLVLPLSVRGSQLSIAFALTAPGLLESVSVRSCAFIRLRGAGADPAPAVTLDVPGWAVQVAERDGPLPAHIGRLLAGPAFTGDPSPEPGSTTDVWDGLGLWCALADPAVFRLLAIEPATGSDMARSMFVTGPNRVAVGVCVDAGVALLMAEPPCEIRAYGADGARAAARMAELVRDWVAAGRPQAADLQIRAVLDSAGEDDAPAPGVVRTPHARLEVTRRPSPA